MEEVTIEKLVHGGQGLGQLADGRKVFVWNALPGEQVLVRIIKKKRSYAEAIAEDIIQAAPERITPEEENYLSTSPWQMMTFSAENTAKRDIVLELFGHEGVKLPEVPDTFCNEKIWGYRNKMEYSFWGDDEGLHLALHRRGSHGKQIVSGSRLAMPVLDTGAQSVIDALNARKNVRGGDLKTLIIRSNQQGETVAALYTKREDFHEIDLPHALKGLRVYFSDPKSPASVPTRLLYEKGNCHLEDTLLGKSFHYTVDAFFQVNPPIFEKALQTIKDSVSKDDITDMYAGVGVIGLSVAQQSVDLIEFDPASVEMAAVNAENSRLNVRVVETSTEQALDMVHSDRTIIFDPPRAGLHPKIIDRVLEAAPQKLVYLSCNPATQARDLALLGSLYSLKVLNVYNFFPRTPHIETLAILNKKHK